MRKSNIEEHAVFQPEHADVRESQACGTEKQKTHIKWSKYCWLVVIAWLFSNATPLVRGVLPSMKSCFEFLVKILSLDLDTAKPD